MDPQAIELSKTSARASLPYAGGLAAALALLAWIPCLGCIVWLAVVFGGPVAIGYLITPKLQNFPAGQSKGMLALYIGLGIGAALAAAFAVGSLVSGILGLILGSAVTGLFDGTGTLFSGAAAGVVGIIISVVASIFVGLTLGTLMAFLGSYMSIDRNQGTQTARPF